MRPDARNTESRNSPSLADQIDALCDRFEAAWRATPRPRIEAFLDQAPRELQSSLLIELLAVELQHRRELGDEPRLDEYLDRFGERRENVREAFQRVVCGDTVAVVKRRSEETFPTGQAFDESATLAVRGDALLDPCGFPQTRRFVNKGRLGEGGMGRVYRAFDTDRGDDVALKVLLHSQDPTRLSRFKDEFRVLSPTEIVHPNLVPLYELMCVENCWFLTMKFVDGVDFCTYCRPHRQLDPARLRDAFRQLTIGIAALHERGILHRDIKPSNVMVCEDSGHVWILDFGLVTCLSQDSLLCNTVQSVAGTFAYMAPEQAAGHAETASDLYSMGILLYQCLTGLLPFRGSPTEVLIAKMERDPTPPGELAPQIPAELNTLCLALLQRQAKSRPTTDELLRVLTQSPGVAEIRRPDVGAHDFIFCGRKPELDVLRRAFGQVVHGDSACVYVSGPSGIGKSTLVRRFLRDLADERPDVVILAGKCYELESVPFKAFDSLVDVLGRWLRGLPFSAADALTPSHAGALARVFPVLGRVEAIAAASAREAVTADEIELRRTAFGALRELLFRLGQRYRLVIVMDDLQWADADSITLLAFLFRLPTPPNLLLVGCYRTEESAVNPVLQELFSLRKEPEYRLAGDDVCLPPMTGEDIRCLASQLLREAPHIRTDEILIESVAAETLGHPLFACCYLNEIMADSAFATGVTSGSSVHLDDVIWNRVNRLPTETRQMLQLIAVAGQPIRERDLFRIAGTGSDDLARLNQLRASSLVRSVGEGSNSVVDTYHDRVREAVLAHTTLEHGQTLHHQLAQALEAAGDSDFESLARHFLAAGRRAQARDYYALAANRAAASLAFDQTVRLYRQALALCSDDDLKKTDLHARLGDGLVNVGRGAEAGEAYLAAAAGRMGLDHLELLRRASLAYLLSGYFDQGMELISTVAKLTGLRLPKKPTTALLSLAIGRFQLWIRHERFRLKDPGQVAIKDQVRMDTCWSIAQGLSMIDYVRGADFAARHLLLAMRAGDPPRVARGLAIMSGNIAAAGGTRSRRRSARLIDRAKAVAAQVRQPYIDGWVSVCEGIRAALLGEWAQTHDSCGKAEQLFESQCSRELGGELAVARFWLLWSCVSLGELAELQSRWPALMRQAEERGDLFVQATCGSQLLAIVRLCQGQPGLASHELHETAQKWTPVGFHIQHHLRMLGEAMVLLYEGECEIAYELLQRTLPHYKKALLWNCQLVRADVQYLRARLLIARSQKDPSSRKLIREALRIARSLEREKMPWISALAALLRGRIAVLQGDDILAAEELRRAAKMAQFLHLGLYAVVANRALGQVLGGSEGRLAVRDSDEWLQTQGVVNPERFAAVF
ncbi:MAG: serine/threonine-protein kinase [Pirellulaceae bacterium]